MVVEIKKAKRFIVIAGVVLAVIVAINVLWGGRSFKEPINSPNSALSESKPEKTISGKVESRSGEDFFAEYRLQRERSRSREMEVLRELARDEEQGQASREAASLKIIGIMEEMEKEMKAENLVKSRGIEECVVISEPGMSTVVIKGSAAAVDENAIKGLIGRVLEVSDENICMVFRGGNDE
ncbi:SpoIIIAH-like family protein [Syntrophomonas curvata]